MPKTRRQKDRIVEELVVDFSTAKSLVTAGYRGLTVKQLEELRTKLREQGAGFRVVKNSLAAIAAKKANLTVELPGVEGQTAFAFGMGDEVAPAKVLYEFGRKNEALEIRAGVLDGQALSKADVLMLAKLPSRQEMLAKTVGTLQAPIAGFVNVLAGNLRGLVTVLSAVRDAKPVA